jgi:hypothetical protein
MVIGGPEKDRLLCRKVLQGNVVRLECGVEWVGVLNHRNRTKYGPGV